MLVMNIQICTKRGIVFTIEGYQNPKRKTWVKERESCPPFSNHKFFWQPMALPQIRSVTTCLLGRFGSLCCKGLLAFVFCWKSMVAMFGFVAMWACTISIPLPNGD